MLGFKHNAGGFGTLGTLASDAETSRGPISLHTAIGEGAGGGRSIRFKAKSGHYPFLALFSGVRGRVILRSSQNVVPANFAAEDKVHAVRVRRLVSAVYSSYVENLRRRVDSPGEQPLKGEHYARESRGRPRARTPFGKYDDNEAAGARPRPRPGLLPRQARAHPGREARGWAALRGSVRGVPPLPLDGGALWRIDADGLRGRRLRRRRRGAAFSGGRLRGDRRARL